MKYRGILILLSALVTMGVALATQAQAGNPVVSKKCVAKLNWAKTEGKRWSGFAANEANGAGQACGWALDFALKSDAAAGALRECRASEYDHPTFGKHGTCKIVYLH